MRRMMSDLPPDATVLDPFMGSGSTALACLQTGHNFVGIEREPEYIEIADTRIRYWDRTENGWSGPDIESDAPSHTERKEVDLFDI